MFPDIWEVIKDKEESAFFSAHQDGRSIISFGKINLLYYTSIQLYNNNVSDE